MKRIEYRALPPHRRHAYTRAVHRLTTLPSRLGLNTSLNDDFTYIHIQLKYQIHHAAIALPWHRYFLHVYEETLRSERGWDRWLLYWDWTLGSGNPGESEIWDAWSGFGGNGTEPQSCVLDSPLGDFKPSYREFGYEPHCVTRKFEGSEKDEEMHSKHYTPEIVRGIVREARTYDEFRERLEDGPHRHLHKGIGGEMKGISSTNDPLFSVHHAQIDRLWWLWQQQNPDTRNHEFFGPVGLENSTVHEMMTTENDVLCSKYDLDF